MGLLTWFQNLQDSAFSLWIKESTSIWPYDILCLSAHSVGMAVLVGLSSAVALRMLGFAPQVPVAAMSGVFPVMYTGLWVNVLSGIGLFVTYPVKAVTNPGFYLKMAGVVIAVVLIRRIQREVFGASAYHSALVDAKGRTLARALLLTWLGTITAGRLMAYHGIAGVEWETVIAVVIVSAAIVLVLYIATRRGAGAFELGAGHAGGSHAAGRR